SFWRQQWKICPNGMKGHTPSCFCLCVMVNIHGVRQEPSRPISRSHTASTPLPSSIHKQQLCPWLQTRRSTSEHNTEPFQTHQELQSPPSKVK
ncbi:hypothetical protein E3U43_012399, partial [Larimichthys crocea]